MARIVSFLLAVSFGAASLLPSAAMADSTTESRLREALRSTTSQLQALEDERGAWQAKEARHAKELESLKKELAAARHGAAGEGRLEGRLTEKTEANEQLSAANAKLTSSLAQCEKVARDAEQAGRAGDDERTRLAADVAELKKRLEVADRRNERMYRVGKQILDWVASGDLNQLRDPVLGLKRVELENIAQDYEDKLLQEKATP